MGLRHWFGAGLQLPKPPAESRNRKTDWQFLELILREVNPNSGCVGQALCNPLADTIATFGPGNAKAEEPLGPSAGSASIVLTEPRSYESLRRRTKPMSSKLPPRSVSATVDGSGTALALNVPE